MIAGKYAELMRSPAATMAIGGLGAAGASLVSNQGDDKSTGRQALEALGAGALGVGVGRALPKVHAAMAKRYPRMAEDIKERAAASKDPVVKQRSAKTLENIARIPQVAANVGAAVGGLGLATGVGGMVGGGVANIGNMAGLAIDPEMPGSSNTVNSRLNMQGYV